MAVSIAVLEQGAGAAEGFDTGSITWSGGVGLIFTASAYDTATSPTHSATKSGDTWTNGGNQVYRLRRGASILTNTSPSNGVITITPGALEATYQDTIYFVCEISGSDGVVPTNIDLDGHTSDAEASPQPITLTDTIDAGDLATFFGMCESSTASHALSTGLDAVGSEETSTNTRSGLVGSTTTDTTPGHEWTGGDQGHAEIALVWNTGAVPVSRAPGQADLVLSTVAPGIEIGLIYPPEFHHGLDVNTLLRM